MATEPSYTPSYGTILPEQVFHHIRRLPKRSQAILWRYFWRGETYAEIGEHIGISGKRVNQILKKALHFLRNDQTWADECRPLPRLDPRKG